TRPQLGPIVDATAFERHYPPCEARYCVSPKALLSFPSIPTKPRPKVASDASTATARLASDVPCQPFTWPLIAVRPTTFSDEPLKNTIDSPSCVLVPFTHFSRISLNARLPLVGVLTTFRR